MDVVIGGCGVARDLLVECALDVASALGVYPVGDALPDGYDSTFVVARVRLEWLAVEGRSVPLV